jgi:4-amino-4-deoxy-L-arabinose transferase-like glycosyltransferase
VVWALILVAPWPIAMALSLWHPTIDPSIATLSQIETDTDFIAPPGSYLLATAVALWPGTAFMALAIPWILDNARRRAVVFLLAAAIPYWLFLEIYPVKLAHLFLPVLPPLAVLAALAIDEGRLPARGAVRWVVALGPVFWAVLISATIVISLGSDGNPVALWPVPAFLASILAGGLASFWLQRGKSAVAAVTVSVVSSIFLGLGIAGLVLPNLAIYRTAQKTVVAGRAALDCPNPRFASVGFAEPSLAFYGGSKILVTNGEGAADFLAGGPCRAAFVERRRQSVFTQRAADIGLETEVRGEVHGLNVGAIRRLRILVIVAKEPAT